MRNLSDEEVTFRLTAADGYFRENGRFSMLPSDQPSTESGTWIRVQSEVTVAGNDAVVVPFTTDVPENATPGDHAAGIAASVLSQRVDQNGATVGVESRVGFRVMTRVMGEVSPSAAVEDVSAVYDVSWNPFAAGAATVRFDVVNEGNTRLTVAGEVDAGGETVEFPAADEPDQELLPGDRRTFSVIVEDVWPLFFVPVELEAVPVVSGQGQDARVDPVTVRVGMWAVPWPQLVVLVGLALVAVSIAWGRARSRHRLAELLERAREEGRRQGVGKSE